jgi:hypothetical protein
VTAALGLPPGIDETTMAAATLLDKGPIDPEMIPCAVCAEPPLVHGDGHEHQVPATYALAMAAAAAADRQVMDDIVEHLGSGYRPSGAFGPRVSDAGGCARAIWYRERPPAGYVPRTDIDQRRAALGKLIHLAADDARSARYPWRRYKLRVPIPGLDKPGEVDEYDPVLGLVVDDKTAGEYKWSVIGESGPTLEHWAQIRIYGYALDAIGWPVRTLRIIAINRDTGEEEHFDEDYDPADGLAALDELIAAATMIEAGAVPPRGGYGPKDWRCQWCPAMLHCWNVDLAARLERSPESVTILGEHPEDPSVAWAGREVLELSAQRLALEQREGRAKALLQGIRPDVYGKGSDQPVEVYTAPHTSYGYKDAYEQAASLVELLAALLPEDKRPDLTGLAVRKNRTYSTSVRRPKDDRAATRKPRKKKLIPAADAAGARLEAALEGNTSETRGGCGE